MNADKTTIAPEVLNTIARLTALSVPGVSRMCSEPGGVGRLFRRGMHEGVHIEVEEDRVNCNLYLVMKEDVNIREVSHAIQQNVSRAISEMVGMQVGYVNIHIEDIDYP
ncbi:MAG: Asp23/Gls24 family envelope stress response protein [Chloroflexi bacterium]|nr:Asp23/Gls24 family envelope stress response protein [Chloroflexota bacterium]